MNGNQFMDDLRAHLSSCNLAECRRVDVAGRLGISVTTMDRRMADTSETFTQLVEAERMSRCQAMMQQRGRRAYGKTMADDLGYREVNSFYRAFLRWHGVAFRDARIGREEISMRGES